MDSVADPIARIAGRLAQAPDPRGSANIRDPEMLPGRGNPPVEAAVLIGLVRRGDGHTVLYTERSGTLRSHSGQIAFPGGKFDPEDEDAASVAVREAEEEVALESGAARIMGYLPNYLSATGYLITPVVAEIDQRGDFVANPDEVAGLFEVPLDLIRAEGTFGRYEFSVMGRKRSTWQIAYEGRNIWGITANMTRMFHEQVLRDA